MGLRIFLLALTFFACSCNAQGIFSTGMKVGIGGSAIPARAILTELGVSSPAAIGSILTTGGPVQYVLGNRVGMESGLNITHYSYYEQPGASFWGRRVWKGSASIEVFNFQLPMLMMYRYAIPSKPFRDFTLAAGTSMDWIASDYFVHAIQPHWMKNAHASIRTGRERPNGNRLELGFEFQYSFKRFTLQEQHEHYNHVINSRLTMLAFNFYYFFFSRKIGKVRSET